jgi:regulator of cell morphogenesis and NO signaling
MSPNGVDLPVWQWVRGHEGRARILAGFGLDYCFGGRTPLGEACSQRGVDVEEVLRALEENDDSQAAADQIDWSGESMARLANHIVSRHHAYLREMLPQLGTLLEEIVAKDADKHPNLVELREVYSAMSEDLLNHMMKEELALFPLIRSLDQALQAGELAPGFHRGSVTAPIHVMEDEHQNTGKALMRMRELTFSFRPPKDACRAYRLLMLGLRELESDLHLHIHKENDILFLRASAAEVSQFAARARSTVPQ